MNLFEALKKESPLQIIGVINAYAGKLAERAGFNALYISGAGVANACFGLPDLAMTTLNDVVDEVDRIANATALPILADIDTGFGGAFNIARTIRSLEKAGAAAVHMEDQVAIKRCGHRPNKQVVDTHEMCDRLKAAVDARTKNDFVIMARTDAFAIEGLTAAIERANAYVNAGAQMIFAEALKTLEDYTQFCAEVPVPVLANITEFGQTPLFTVSELASAKVQLILYPLSGFRMMNKAMIECLQTIKKMGTQKALIDKMQTRQELYDVLDYYTYETKLDEFNRK